MESDREHPGKESQIGENFRFWVDEWEKTGSTRKVRIGFPAGKDGQMRPLEAADLYLWALRRCIAGKGQSNPLWALMQKTVPARDTLISQSAIRDWFGGMPIGSPEQDTRQEHAAKSERQLQGGAVA